jgi:hypothetical protein
MEHDPTPWKTANTYAGGPLVVCRADGLTLVVEGHSSAQWKANAEFIVRAANNHEGLLEACEALCAEAVGQCPLCLIDESHAADCPVRLAEAAIAKAKSNG